LAYCEEGKSYHFGGGGGEGKIGVLDFINTAFYSTVFLQFVANIFYKPYKIITCEKI
jgi:hypothetical protein